MMNPLVLLRLDGNPAQSALTCMPMCRTALFVLSVVVTVSVCSGLRRVGASVAVLPSSNLLLLTDVICAQALCGVKEMSCEGKPL